MMYLVCRRIEDHLVVEVQILGLGLGEPMSMCVSASLYELCMLALTPYPPP